jgi:dipeptidyl aminopeptidase/acylaminoacyl peptidase
VTRTRAWRVLHPAIRIVADSTGHFKPSMKDFAAEDLYQHRVLSGLDGSSRHGRVVFKMSRAKRGSEHYESSVWHLDVDGDSGPRRMTDVAFGASSPMLSPDASSLAFLSKRGGKHAQVQLLPTQGGEAHALTDSEHVIGSILGWSADGKRLLVTAKVQWSEAPNQGDRDARQRSKDTGSDSPQVASFLPYKKDGRGVIVGERTHLFAVDAERGDMQVLVDGDVEVTDAAWSPDGRLLATVRHRGGRQRHRTDLWLADADGASPRQRTRDIASVQKAAWSPDGRWLAVVGGRIEGDSMTQVWLLDPHGAAPPRLLGGEDFELSPSSGVIWHADGDRIAVIDEHRGLQSVVVIDVESGRLTRLRAGLRQVMAIANCGGRIAFAVASMRWPEEIHSVCWDGSDERRHTAFNRSWFARRARPHVRKRRIAVPDGDGGSETIDAWLLLPPSGEAPYPLLVDMHGGPQSHVQTDYSMNTYWYPLLSQGWAIVAPNAVGSSGYGTEFAKRLRGRWGQLDLPQYMAVIDTLQREGVADARIACTGKSYGGYLAAWAIGHTDRFKAAIVSAPVSDLWSHAGTSDTGYYVTAYAMDGELPDARERCHALSPVDHCNDATTPTLILQGAEDQRCPIGQSEQLFAQLIRHAQAPAQLVVYPGGSHSLAESGKPSHRVDYNQRLCDWATQWTLQRQGAQPCEAKAHDGAVAKPERLRAAG